MKKLNFTILALILSVFFVSCKSTGNEKYTYSLIKVSKVTIDEKKVVLPYIPSSLMYLNDTTLGCIQGYRDLVSYNLNNGLVSFSCNVDSFLSSKFDIVRFSMENCVNTYSGRKYITDIEEIRKQQMPFFKVLKVLGTPSSLDSVNILTYIFTPYLIDMTYQGRKIPSVSEDYSLMIVNLNLNNYKINKYEAIKMNLVENSLGDNKNGFVNPEFGSYLDGNNFYSRLLPDNEKGSKMVAVYELGNQQKVEIDSHPYPDKFIKDIAKWMGMMNFVKDNNGDVLCNGMCNIFSLNNKSFQEISLEKQLNVFKFERLTNFSKIGDNRFIIQTYTTDSTNVISNFKFYDSESDTLTASKLSLNARTMSKDVVFKDSTLIFISKDEESYYIEKYKIESKRM